MRSPYTAALQLCLSPRRLRFERVRGTRDYCVYSKHHSTLVNDRDRPLIFKIAFQGYLIWIGLPLHYARSLRLRHPTTTKLSLRLVIVKALDRTFSSSSSVQSSVKTRSSRPCRRNGGYERRIIVRPHTCYNSSVLEERERDPPPPPPSPLFLSIERTYHDCTTRLDQPR